MSVTTQKKPDDNIGNNAGASDQSSTETGSREPDHSPTPPSADVAHAVDVAGAVFVAGQVVEADPATLLVDVNVRADARLDAGFVASIKDHGVLQPIVALITAEGALRVRYGHRRTLAAISAGRAVVPVLIAGNEADTDAGTKAAKAAGIDRVLKQYAENTDRAGLTRGEEVGVVEQLAAFGLSPAQIAKRTRIKRDTVDTALTVAKSELARKATDRYESLTLEQAAVVAEFEDDTETVTALIAASATGRFEHVAQRARDERERERVRLDLVKSLEDAGVSVIDAPPLSNATTSLTRIADNSGPDLSPTEHATCPGHVAWTVQDWITIDADGNQVTDEEIEALEKRLDETGDDGEPVDQDAATAYDALRQAYGWTARYGCSDPVANGHQSPQNVPAGLSEGSEAAGGGPGAQMSAEEAARAAEEQAKAKAAASAARRLVIENNKAWQASETVRRDWIVTNLTQRKTAPKGTTAFLATAMANDARPLTDCGRSALVAGWVGDPRKVLTETATANLTEGRALVVTLLQVLAAYEADLTKDSWRRDGTHTGTGRYLRFLAHIGYTLSDVEEYAIGKNTI